LVCASLAQAPKAQTLGVFYAYPPSIGYEGEYIHLFNNYWGPGCYVSMLNHPKHEYGDYYEPFEGDEYISSYEHTNRYGWSFGLNQRIFTGLYVYAGYTRAYNQTLRTDYYYDNSEYALDGYRLYEVASESYKTRSGLDVGIVIACYSAGFNIGYNFPLRTWSFGIGYCF
jgi:hypothetical protein